MSVNPDELGPPPPDPVATAAGHADAAAISSANASSAADAAATAAHAAQDAANAAKSAADAALAAGAGGGASKAPRGTERATTDLSPYLYRLERQDGKLVKVRIGEPVHLNKDGTIDCRLCGLNIVFLPESFPAEDLPAGAPRTVNHPGCSGAPEGESPAAVDPLTGFHETVNVVDQKEIAAFYRQKAGAK